MRFVPALSVELIEGGLPAKGRNAGAERARSRYVLFMDADIEFGDVTLIRRSVEMMEKYNLHCLTTNIRCMQGGTLDHALYVGNNLVQRIAAWTRPFATGMYMMFDRELFWRLGGFDEKALYAEDYLLTQKVSPFRFRIVNGAVFTSNRRFKKMGHGKIARMFLNTALHTFDRSYFYRDQNYWTGFDSAEAPKA